MYKDYTYTRTCIHDYTDVRHHNLHHTHTVITSKHMNIYITAKPDKHTSGSHTKTHFYDFR